MTREVAKLTFTASGCRWRCGDRERHITIRQGWRIAVALIETGHDIATRTFNRRHPRKVLES
jgi:hypothetical protein